MLKPQDYYMGRDKLYPDELTEEYKFNTLDLLSRVNKLLEFFYKANPKAITRKVSSGWRPAAINAKVKNAAKRSSHMICMGIDLTDDDGELDTWCSSFDGHKTLEACDLYMEHPSATPRWCHLQSRKTKSGRRIFYP